MHAPMQSAPSSRPQHAGSEKPPDDASRHQAAGGRSGSVRLRVWSPTHGLSAASTDALAGGSADSRLETLQLPSGPQSGCQS